MNFYNWNIHKTKVHLHIYTLHTNASRAQNAVADSEINQILNLQNLDTKNDNVP